jgi:hypothetical protein
MYDARRMANVLALAALTVGGAAGAAHAGTASGRPAQFTAVSGEHNDLTVDVVPGGAVQFSDAGPLITPGLWCLPLPPGAAQCDPDGDPRDTDGGGVIVDVGDRDDQAIVRGLPGTGPRPGMIRVAGGAGNDHIESSGNGFVRFDGGAGDDTLVAGPAAAGANLLGGPGADLMASSAGCCALASYADHNRAGVRVTLDRKANDGAAGEGDDVRTGGVIGSPGPDVITGDARANALTGSGGADVLAGGGGDDSIDATLQDVPASDGPDGPDTVTCGAGDDEVAADRGDKVAVDCERIRVGLAGGPEIVFDIGAARAGRTGSVRFSYRVRFPNPDNAVASRSTFRLVDGKGRAASSTARFLLGGPATVARPRVKLSRATRRRLARSRSGKLRLIAQRVSRDARPGSTASGYEQVNVPVAIRRANPR